MNEAKALDLVKRYSCHAKSIKELGKKIWENLDQCQGVDGKRLECDSYGCLVNHPKIDSKNRDKSTHLWNWYQPKEIEATQYTDGGLVYQKITAEKHGKECHYCYAAHVAIQERKEHRKKLGAVKGAMTRRGAE